MTEAQQIMRRKMMDMFNMAKYARQRASKDMGDPNEQNMVQAGFVKFYKFEDLKGKHNLLDIKEKKKVEVFSV